MRSGFLTPTVWDTLQAEAAAAAFEAAWDRAHQERDAAVRWQQDQDRARLARFLCDD